MSTGTPPQAWFVKSQSGVKGPFSSAQLAALARDGKISGDALIARSDSGPWHPAKSVKGLSFPAESPANSAPTPSNQNRQAELADSSQYDDEDSDAAFFSRVASASNSPAASVLSDSPPTDGAVEQEPKGFSLPLMFAIGGVVAVLALGIAIYIVDSVLTKNRIARERVDFANAITAAESAVPGDVEAANNQHKQLLSSQYAADEQERLKNLATLIARQEARQLEDKLRKKQTPLWGKVNESLEALARSPKVAELAEVRDAVNALISEPEGPWHSEARKLLEDLSTAENPIIETNGNVLTLIAGAQECPPLVGFFVVPQELRRSRGTEMAEYARRELARPGDYFQPFLQKQSQRLADQLGQAETLRAKNGDFSADALRVGGLMDETTHPALRAVRLEKVLLAMSEAKDMLDKALVAIEDASRTKQLLTDWSLTRLTYPMPVAMTPRLREEPASQPFGNFEKFPNDVVVTVGLLFEVIKISSLPKKLDNPYVVRANQAPETLWSIGVRERKDFKGTLRLNAEGTDIDADSSRAFESGARAMLASEQEVRASTYLDESKLVFALRDDFYRANEGFLNFDDPGKDSFYKVSMAFDVVKTISPTTGKTAVVGLIYYIDVDPIQNPQMRTVLPNAPPAWDWDYMSSRAPVLADSLQQNARFMAVMPDLLKAFPPETLDAIRARVTAD